MRTFRDAGVLLGLMLLAFLGGCATSPATPTVSEDLLATAGFRTVPAQTDVQQQHLRALPQGVVTEMQQTGKHYYVYPDVVNDRLYVGTPKEYKAYLDLRANRKLPNPTPSDTTRADMQQYLARDAAMTKADAQRVEPYSWATWPDFEVLFTIR
jgi:hypothetical protein